MLIGFRRRFGPKGRDLDRFIPEHRVHELETAPNQPRAADVAMDLIGGRVGCDVIVFWVHAQHEITHRAPDDVGLEAGIGQGLANLARTMADRIAANAMLLEW